MSMDHRRGPGWESFRFEPPAWVASFIVNENHGEVAVDLYISDAEAPRMETIRFPHRVPPGKAARWTHWSHWTEAGCILIVFLWDEESVHDGWEDDLLPTPHISPPTKDPSCPP